MKTAVNFFKNLKWNVYIENFNGRTIEEHNIFDHYGLVNSLLDKYNEIILSKITKDAPRSEVTAILEANKEAFIEGLKRELGYYYWAKAEWEVVITTWPPYIDTNEIKRIVKEDSENTAHRYRTYVNVDVGEKVDVYKQIQLNWDHFVDYVWAAVTDFTLSKVK